MKGQLQDFASMGKLTRRPKGHDGAKPVSMRACPAGGRSTASAIALPKRDTECNVEIVRLRGARSIAPRVAFATMT
jgi:hypothetical protein